MSAQTEFNGVTLDGVPYRPIIINQSDKPILGYALQHHRTIGISPVQVVVDIARLTMGELIQPGEERALFYTATGTGEEIQMQITGYELKAVLFADGTFYGPDSILSEFSSKISIARSLALEMQNAGHDKYQVLEHNRQTMTRLLDVMCKGAHAGNRDFGEVDLRSLIARLLWICNNKGEQEADAALARIASLPGVTRGG
jgi:hypothetical protein